MKLYYAAGACSRACHIALHEIGATFETEAVDLGSKKTASGGDYRAINPKGYVPALQLDDGSVLTEAAAILQYLADSKPEAGLLAPVGDMTRYRTLEWLNFIGTELHKGLGQLFNPKMPEDFKPVVLATAGMRLDYLDRHLGQNKYLLGDTYSIADAYLFTIIGWAKWVGVDLAKWPGVSAFRQRMFERPAVQKVLEAEKA